MIAHLLQSKEPDKADTAPQGGDDWRQDYEAGPPVSDPYDDPKASWLDFAIIGSLLALAIALFVGIAGGLLWIVSRLV